MTLMTLKRESAPSLLVEFDVASEPGNEREAMQRVAKAVGPLGLSGARLERLKTAVAEATMNAIEHGNQNRPELPVQIRVTAAGHELRVSITDQGGSRPMTEPETPDLEAKLQGLQQPRGWGLFLIRNMVDELDTSSDAQHHTITLTLHLDEEAAHE